MKILVTGGAGFIGSHIVESFQGRATVRVLDNLRTGYRRNLDGLSCEFIEGSILDRDAVDAAVAGCDYVFHLAAMISVPESMHKPRECVDLNTTGTLHVLEAAAAAGCKKLVLASSAAIYGDNPTVPKVETMVPEPRSPYAITKLDGEYYLDMFAREGRIETASLRFFNVFGPRQDPKSAYAAAVPIFIERALSGEPLRIFGDGEQTRDFIYVKDIVQALSFAAMTPGLSGTYNVGYGGRITINHLAGEILRLLGSSSPIEHGPERAGDVRHSLASADKLRAAGWRPSHNLSEGLAATVAYFRDRKKT
jgi:UDP-glucose 4-epimerase